jgi:hypothetical protein
MVVMMIWNGGGWPVWEVALMWVAMIAVLGLLIWAGYALAAGSSRHRGGEPGAGSGGPRQIPDEWLASGEIDTAEYQRLLHLTAAGDGDLRLSAGRASGGRLGAGALSGLLHITFTRSPRDLRGRGVS